ncbi:hypothetical protein [Mumia sp. Pv 4-285]|uniref:hypothetical protein n=1 Tax=Mumia qirimensis TaxID=3234852 RepID=UPI00351D4AC0
MSVRSIAVTISMVLTGAFLPASPGAASQAPTVTAGVAQPERATPTQPAVEDARKKRKRARIKASRHQVATGRVVVSIRSNARRVRVFYRSARGKKRVQVVRIRAKRGKVALPKGSKRVFAQAKKTHRLRASRKIRVTVVRAPRVWLADADGNGTLDYYYDREADGRVDAILFDEDRNGRYEMIAVYLPTTSGAALDQQEDGYFELFLVDADRNGLGERAYYDPNQDGFPEWQQVDTNGDGYADTWVQTAPSVGTATQNQTANNLMVSNIVTLNQLRALDPWSVGYLPYNPAPSLLR